MTSIVPGFFENPNPDDPNFHGLMGKLVHVCWHDAEIVVDTWVAVVDLPRELPTCHTVGWVVSDCEEYLMVANTVGVFRHHGASDSATVSGASAIPTAMMVTIEILDFDNPEN